MSKNYIRHDNNTTDPIVFSKCNQITSFDEPFDCFLKQIFHKKKCLNYKILSGS